MTGQVEWSVKVRMVDEAVKVNVFGTMLENNHHVIYMLIYQPDTPININGLSHHVLIVEESILIERVERFV